MITAITNGRLLDCVGDEPLEDASVVVEEGLIKDVYTEEKAQPSEAMVIDAGGRTVMPGLSDAHAHPSLSHFHIPWSLQEQPFVAAILVKNNCEGLLQYREVIPRGV